MEPAQLTLDFRIFCVSVRGVGFGPCFSAPTYRTFTGPAVGLIAQTRRRTVCGMSPPATGSAPVHVIGGAA